MSLDDWNGMQRFLSDETGAWLNFTSQSTLECVEEHQEAVERNKELEDLYMSVYGDEVYRMVNPDVKYDYEGRLE